MTNEELCAIVQAGDKQALAQLWEQNTGLLFAMFRRLMANPNSSGRAEQAGVTMDDLMQDGYFAIVRAVDTYDRAAGAKFTTYLAYSVKTVFFTAIGMRTQKQRKDPLTIAKRLDEPVYNDDGDEIDRYALIPDPSNDFASIDQSDYAHSLHNALEACLATLPEEIADIIKARYYEGKPAAQVGRELDKSGEWVQRQESKGLYSLRRPACTKQLKPFYNDIICQHSYTGTGFSTWKNSGSTEERAVERLDLL